MSVLNVLKKKKSAVPETKKENVSAASSAHVIRSVIQRPHVSEKSYGLHAQNQYAFVIDPSANKTLVKEEVQRRYNVRVVGVSVVVAKGKAKYFRGHKAKMSPTKKAIVTLKEGDKIEIV